MRPTPTTLPSRRFVVLAILVMFLFQFGIAPLLAQPVKGKSPANAAQPKTTADKPDGMSIRQSFDDAGWIGFVIIAMSVAMVALIIEHTISFRRGALMPAGLAEQTHQFIKLGQFKQAHQACQQKHSFLGYVLSAGLTDVSLGYSAVEKAMEDASTEQSARMFRKIEYLSVIGTLAPMIGLLGTVWGLMLAFQEFELSANPHISELAPGIRKAMVTTLMGLMVAVPALAAFAIFRIRIDELVAESSLMAEHVFADFKRSVAKRRTAPVAKPAAEQSAVRRPQATSPPTEVSQ